MSKILGWASLVVEGLTQNSVVTLALLVALGGVLVAYAALKIAERRKP